MSNWYKGSHEINCGFSKILESFENIGDLYVNITKLMPGLSIVELVEQSESHVVIKTNEGLMNRSNISRKLVDECLTISYDEDYQAGKTIRVISHIEDVFISENDITKHKLSISDVNATGFMGFLYRTFGKSNIGNSQLKAYKEFFEN